MKRLSLYLLPIFFVAAFMLANPQAASANAGPVGLNEIRTESGPGVGEITLMWRRYSLNLTNYSIVYGTKPGVYKYGAYQIGNIVTYTVKSLVPGQNYCFKLYPHI